MGANNPDEAKRMTNLILSISIVYAIVMMVIFNGLTDFLMSVFAVGMRETNDEIQQTTKLMLHLISIVATCTWRFSERDWRYCLGHVVFH